MYKDLGQGIGNCTDSEGLAGMSGNSMHGLLVLLGPWAIISCTHILLSKLHRDREKLWLSNVRNISLARQVTKSR